MTSHISYQAFECKTDARPKTLRARGRMHPLSPFQFTVKTFKIDKAGKRQEWEAITIVDFVDPNIKIFEKNEQA